MVPSPVPFVLESGFAGVFRRGDLVRVEKPNIKVSSLDGPSLIIDVTNSKGFESFLWYFSVAMASGEPADRRWFPIQVTCPTQRSRNTSIMVSMLGIFAFQGFLYSWRSHPYNCLNFWDEAWWFLLLRVFGLLSSSSLLFQQRFGRYILRPSSGVCRTCNLQVICVGSQSF